MDNVQNQTSTVNTADKSIKGAKALFWYLTLFFSLGIIAFNIGALWFQYINNWFNQEVASGLVRSSFSQQALKFAIASLLVSTPIFFLFSLMIRKALKKSRLDRHNKIRVWITYIILFLTIAIAIGDLITTIFRVLDGDFTLRFLLKALVILLISAWIFIYYGMELKSQDSLNSSKLPKAMAYATIGIIVASIIGAFFLVDSPTVARTKAYDRTRENDLRNISYNIDSFYYNEQTLPESLEDLTVKVNLKDPKTKEVYKYETVSEDEYKLCAAFETSNSDTNDTEYDYYYYGERSFIHDVGEKCFSFKISEQNIIKTEPRPIPID